MKRVLMAGGAMFAFGFAVAWLVKPDSGRVAAVPSVKPENPRNGPARRNPDLVRNAVPSRVKACLDKIDAAARTKDGYQQFVTVTDEIRELPTSDIPLMIEQMSRRAGFSGLDYQRKRVLEDLVKNWYDKEPQAALDWVSAMENVPDRQNLMSVMIGKAAEKDFDHAVGLAKTYGTKELGGLDMPHEIQEKLGSLGVERLFEVLRAFPTSEGRTGSSITFAADFSFRDFASLLTEDPKVLEQMSFFPGNFLQEWTRRDHQEAWAWVTAKENGDSLPFTDPSDFFDAYRTGHSVEEINTLILDYMSRQTDDERKYRFAWDSLANRVDTAQIQDFLARLPGERSENLRRIVAMSTHGSGGSYDEFKEALCGLMSPQERIEVLPRALGGSIPQDDQYQQILKRLGHSDAVIQSMFSVPGKK